MRARVVNILEGWLEWFDLGKRMVETLEKMMISVGNWDGEEEQTVTKGLSKLVETKRKDGRAHGSWEGTGNRTVCSCVHCSCHKVG